MKSNTSPYIKILWLSTLMNNSYGEVTKKYYNMIKKYSNWGIICVDVYNNNILNKIIKFQPNFIIILWNGKNIKFISEKIFNIRDKWYGKLISFIPIDSINPIEDCINHKSDFYLSIKVVDIFDYFYLNFLPFII